MGHHAPLVMTERPFLFSSIGNPFYLRQKLITLEEDSTVKTS